MKDAELVQSTERAEVDERGAEAAAGEAQTEPVPLVACWSIARRRAILRIRSLSFDPNPPRPRA